MSPGHTKHIRSHNIFTITSRLLWFHRKLWREEDMIISPRHMHAYSPRIAPLQHLTSRCSITVVDARARDATSWWSFVDVHQLYLWLYISELAQRASNRTPASEHERAAAIISCRVGQYFAHSPCVYTHSIYSYAMTAGPIMLWLHVYQVHWAGRASASAKSRVLIMKNNITAHWKQGNRAQLLRARDEEVLMRDVPHSFHHHTL